MDGGLRAVGIGDDDVFEGKCRAGEPTAPDFGAEADGALGRLQGGLGKGFDAFGCEEVVNRCV